ncbi:hypothetical protein NDU88_002904 [Pleurodeles waltl]|uniref:Uncharacterized protein n=1 Tax=Pleurodeles waltl TaxID=8319 RepID=A0AAV7W0M1_PLEWA|nr:hypothetical protein NDU88_002904 [Pleurodeles waltl]
MDLKRRNPLRCCNRPVWVEGPVKSRGGGTPDPGLGRKEPDPHQQRDHPVPKQQRKGGPAEPPKAASATGNPKYRAEL